MTYLPAMETEINLHRRSVIKCVLMIIKGITGSEWKHVNIPGLESGEKKEMNFQAGRMKFRLDSAIVKSTDNNGSQSNKFFLRELLASAKELAKFIKT